MGLLGRGNRASRPCAIGYFDDGELRAGTGRYLAEIIGALDRKRFHPVFFAPVPRAWHEDLSRLDVEIIYAGDNTAPSAPSGAARPGVDPVSKARRPRLPASVAWTAGLLRDTGRLSRLFRKRPVDLLHSNNTGAEPAPIAARLARIPRVIGTLHVLPSADLHGVRDGARYRLLEKTSMCALHHIIACCDAARRDWCARCALPPGRVTIIHNGIEMLRMARKHSKSEARRLLNLPLDAYVTATIGNLHPIKGQEFLLRSLPDIAARNPNVIAIFAGTGPAEPDLRRLVEELRLQRHVRFLGFRAEVGSLLDAADVFVQPSLTEAFPMAILEAAAAQLPVVATAVGGVPEAVQDGVTGLLVPPCDVSALCRAIVSLADCPDRRLRFGQAGQAYVRANFTREQMLEKTTALYDRMLS